MRDEIARGQPASDAAATVKALLEIAGPAADLVRDVLAAAIQSDPAAVRTVLVRAQFELGLAACLDFVLMPALKQVGTWWASGRCDIDQEHLATEAALDWIDSVNSLAPKPTDEVPIMLACGPTDLHTVGLESLALLLRYCGRTCHVLGDRTSITDLTNAVRINPPCGIVIVSHMNSGRRSAIEALHAASTHGTQVFYAGNAFNSARSRRNLPGIYLGTRLEAACDLITIATRKNPTANPLKTTQA